MSVMLSSYGKKKRYLVHRLVASAFIENPGNLPEINHKDEDKSNNHVENLEWCTHEYNNQYGTKQQRGHEKQSKAVKQIKDGKVIAVYSISHGGCKKKRAEHRAAFLAAVVAS